MVRSLTTFATSYHSGNCIIRGCYRPLFKIFTWTFFFILMALYTLYHTSKMWVSEWVNERVSEWVSCTSFISQELSQIDTWKWFSLKCPLHDGHHSKNSSTVLASCFVWYFLILIICWQVTTMTILAAVTMWTVLPFHRQPVFGTLTMLTFQNFSANLALENIVIFSDNRRSVSRLLRPIIILNFWSLNYLVIKIP